jgi:hypothetical protein
MVGIAESAAFKLHLLVLGYRHIDSKGDALGKYQFTAASLQLTDTVLLIVSIFKQQQVHVVYWESDHYPEKVQTEDRAQKNNHTHLAGNIANTVVAVKISLGDVSAIPCQ